MSANAMCSIEAPQLGHIVKVVKEAVIFSQRVSAQESILKELPQFVRDFFLAGFGALATDEFEETVDLILKQAEERANEAVQAKYRAWKLWADQAFLRGAGAAHRYTKPPVAPERSQPMVFASPHALADRELDKWKKV